MKLITEPQTINPTIQPQVGQFLYATCSAEDYGKILRVGIDANNTPVIDIELSCADDIAWTEDEDPEFPHPDLSSVELPPETKVILRDIQFKLPEPWSDGQQPIICRTPGNGCWRCTKSFLLRSTPA